MASGELILPFLKWAGGKRWLTNHPDFELPNFSGRYIEPFLGGGSVFFSLQPRNALLSDMNRELIAAYCAIRDSHETVVRHLYRHAKKHSHAYYYYVRDRFHPTSEAGKAARFLYLNRTCWNGLYRVNLQGRFNVPKGTKENVMLDTDDFASISAALRNAEIRCSDFETAIDRAREGDLVYADPPYTVHHNYNGFIKYNEVLFSWDDQIRLRDCLVRAAKRGVAAVVSNADHTSIRKLYGSIGKRTTISRRSVISGDARGRKPTAELVISL
jgi:DNA adenine methylase